MNNVSKIWWLHPVWIYFMWTLFSIYCSTINSKSFYEMYEEPIYINSFNIALYIAFFIVFTLGFFSYTSRGKKYNSIIKYPLSKIKKIFLLLYVWVISAYIIWFVNLYISYGNSIILGLLSNLAGYANMFKDGGGRISGITTFTELAIVVAPLNTYLWCISKKKIYRNMYIFLLFISILRAIIFSERLAVLEIIIPSLVIYSYYGKIFRSSIIKFAPILGVVFLLIVFGSFEYFRSWDFYKEAYDGNIISFTIDRVFGYYSISINTECIWINFMEPKFFLDHSLSWLWNLPAFSSVKDMLWQQPQINILERWGNPEFNNPGGLLFAYNDLGFLGLIIQFIFGRFVGIVYRGYCKKGFISSLWYSATYLCMLELPRYFFWGSSRAFFAIVAILIIQKYIRKNNSHEINAFIVNT